MRLHAKEFADLMAAFGPFEAKPRLAVAVSGGADSLALTLLAADWAKARGGAVLALTVDHGLRKEAAAEARQVAKWLRARRIAHRVLRWQGTKPKTGIQAAAREARYGLLMERCRKEGILHLLLAHHAEDQAETFLFRLARGSGVEGLAGMPRLSERADLRLLRPLLDIPKDRLRETLEAEGQAWIEDPSNRNRAFARVRLRDALPALARDGVTVERLQMATRHLAQVRAELETVTAMLLAAGATLYPEGYARLRGEPFRSVPVECAESALDRLLRAVGGSLHGPRRERLGRLCAAMREAGLGKGRTLGGCRVLPERDGFLFCRERRGNDAPLAVPPGAALRWDARFAVEMAKARQGSEWAKRARGVRLRPLGARGWAEITAAEPALRAVRLPAAVRPTLPALWDRRGVLCVPHLGYAREAFAARIVKRLDFRPVPPLAGPAFPV
ncbi:MAG: tRNA lysidine(34) synthetase TilS [Alphaproteobacteria bacterium]|nr:tRNA lysidine(34) synthetase TilS [Alphaproteobacteria bacterium]